MVFTDDENLNFKTGDTCPQKKPSEMIQISFDSLSTRIYRPEQKNDQAIRRLGFFKKMKPCTALHIHMCTKDFQSEVRTHKVQKLIYNLYSDHKCTFLKPIFFCMITLSICRCRQSRSRCSHSLHLSVYLY